MSFGRRPPVTPPRRAIIATPGPACWPFVYPLAIELPSSPAAIVVDDLHEAFVNHQTAGTRLVTTQATFLMTQLMSLIGDRDCVLEARADGESLLRYAPELLGGKGPFAGWSVLDAPSAPAPSAPSAPGAPGAPGLDALIAAFRTDDPGERLRLCIEALNLERTPAALVATASVCMEVNDLEAAARDLDEALGLAPEWAAAHFERGKVWLRLDNMEQAAASFRAAAERLPRFGPAWSNLGATLGELDRPEEALQAFTNALACDASSAQTHNNIGVVRRELGQLAESESAFRRVIDLTPDLAFGYYNLGHTLFLQGRYQAALGAYAEGQKRDPERNPVQASRLALCRLATGDAAGAIHDLQRATSALTGEYRRQLLADTQTITWALLTHRPDLPGWQDVHDWLTRAQAM
jgi:tetratricopeptide (TPR) repeat protein